MPNDLRAEITRIVEEARTARRARTGPGGLTVEQLIERNVRRYVGDHWGDAHLGPRVEGGEAPSDFPAASRRRYTINRTQQAIIAQSALAFERPEQVRFRPVESRDPVQVFVRPEVGMQIMDMVAQGAIPEEALADYSSAQLQGAEPMDEPLGERLRESIGLLDEDTIRVNDSMKARVVQKIWDTLYRRARGSYYLSMNELYTSIMGAHPFVIDFDPGTDGHPPKFEFSNPHILDVFVSPEAETVRDAEAVVLEEHLPVEKAKREFPEHEDALENAGSRITRNVEFPGDTQRERRPMVKLRTAWLRYRKVPARIDEALAQGLVRESREPVGTDGREVPELAEELDGEMERVVLRRTDTGGRTSPGAANWPEVEGVLMVRDIPTIETIVFEGRNPWSDIPVRMNKNIPVPYSIYGQGEPERVEDLQQAINRLFSILHNHARFYQAPMEFWPEDLYQELRSRGFAPYSRPGRIVPVRRDIYEMMMRLGGQQGFGVINTIPPVPSFYVDLLQLLLAEHDRSSGFTDVLQGQAPARETSGRAIEALQTAARGPIGLKTSFTEHMLTEIAEIGLDAIRRFLPFEQIRDIVTDLPDAVLGHVLDGIERMRFNVDVAIVSGRGVNEAMDQERALELYMGGEPTRLLSRQTTMDRIGVEDADREQRLINEENASQFVAEEEEPQGLEAAAQPARRGQAPQGRGQRRRERPEGATLRAPQT